MIRYVAAAFLQMLGVAGAQAEDFGPPRAIGETFNTFAKAMRVSQRLVLRECNGASVCLFSAPGHVTILASADAATPDRTQLIAFAADQKSDPKEFVATASVAMFSFSPKKEAGEVRAAFKILFAPPLEDYRDVQIGDVKFVLKQIAPGAIAFTVKDAALP